MINNEIPSQYYSFPMFEELESRTKAPKMLTDYIGRVENSKQTIIKTGKRLKKITIQDIRGNLLEITFWPSESSIFPHDIKEGDILTITSTAVTKYNGALQLETTPATTVVVNPTTPETAAYTSRLRELVTRAITQPDTSIIIITELLSKQTSENTQQNRFNCLAKVRQLHNNRNWYYVYCPKCNKKMHIQKEPRVRLECEDDENVDRPKFMYCVNATIIDETSTAEAVYFD